MTLRTQTRYPTTVVSDATVGTLPWATPEEADASDNVYAEVANSSGASAITEYLKGTGYGFGVLSAAEILGCKAQVEKSGVTHKTITVVAAASATGSSGGWTISKPSGVQEGDVLVFFGQHNASTAISPSGTSWTSLASSLPNSSRVVLLLRVAGPSEPSSYNFVVGANAAGGIVAFRGVDPDNPVDVTAAVSTDASGVPTYSAPSLNVVTAGAALVTGFAGVSISSATWSTPSGMTEQFDRTNTVTAALHTQILAAAGATGTRSSTCSTGLQAAAIAVALRPESVAAVDDDVALVLPDGTVGSINKASDSEWPATDTVVEYEWDAAELATEGIDSPADVNDEDFGLVLSATLPDEGEAQVDAMALVVTYEISLDITPTTSIISQPNATLEATFEVDGSACTMNDTRWRIYADAAGTQLVYDSGVVVSSATSHVIGSGTPTVPWTAPQNGTYYLRVTGTEDGTADPNGVGDPITGDSGLTALTASWTKPAAPTGLAAVAVTEAP